MIDFVADACRVVGGKLIIVVESDTLSELIDNQITKKAVEFAQTQFGWSNACLNGQDSPAPVDENGNTPDSYDELTKLAGKPGVKYRKQIYLVNRF